MQLQFPATGIVILKTASPALSITCFPGSWAILKRGLPMLNAKGTRSRPGLCVVGQGIWRGEEKLIVSDQGKWV